MVRVEQEKNNAFLFLVELEGDGVRLKAYDSEGEEWELLEIDSSGLTLAASVPKGLGIALDSKGCVKVKKETY